MNMHTPRDKCLMVFSSYYLPRNQFFLSPESLPASLEKWVKSILLPWKLTDEQPNTLGQVHDGVCRWLTSKGAIFRVFQDGGSLFLKSRVGQNPPTRVGDFDPLKMFKGVIFLLSIFLKLNSDHFPFFWN